MNGLRHIPTVCDGTCEKNSGVRCYICNGLVICSVCSATEGELLTFCPGYQLNWQAKNACYYGNVLDFSLLKKMNEQGFNLRKKTWDK